MGKFLLKHLICGVSVTQNSKQLNAKHGTWALIPGWENNVGRKWNYCSINALNHKTAPTQSDASTSTVMKKRTRGKSNSSYPSSGIKGLGGARGRNWKEESSPMDGTLDHHRFLHNTDFYPSCRGSPAAEMYPHALPTDFQNKMRYRLTSLTVRGDFRG